MTQSNCSRRSFAAIAAATMLGRPLFAAESDRHAFFIAEAARMKELAIASGDQAYGAVVVLDGEIVGYGPSRVIVDNNIDAHAERVALWDAQRRLGRDELSGAVIYSTSHPCSICRAALAAGKIERMYYGPAGKDGGRP
jgi:tRNA(Arg) A34 adenosine deaminase TadA